MFIFKPDCRSELAASLHLKDYIDTINIVRITDETGLMVRTVLLNIPTVT